MDLSPRQKQVWDLRHSTDPLMPLSKIAKELQISLAATKQAWYKGKDKMENPIVGQQTQDMTAKRVEYKEPEKAAHFIDAVTEPGKTIKAAAEESGLPVSTAQNLMERVDREYQAVGRELDRIKTQDLRNEFENLSLRLIQSVDKTTIDKMQGYQRVVASAICLDKRELLDGRPTERISVEDRRALTDLLPILIAEAERRGLQKEINPETGKASLAYREDASFTVRSGYDRMPVIDVETD